MKLANRLHASASAETAGPGFKCHIGRQIVGHMVGDLTAQNNTAALKAASAGIAAKQYGRQVGLPFAVRSPPVIERGLQPHIHTAVALAGHQERPVRIAQPLQCGAKPVEVRARFGMDNALPWPPHNGRPISDHQGQINAATPRAIAGQPQLVTSADHHGICCQPGNPVEIGGGPVRSVAH